MAIKRKYAERTGQLEKPVVGMEHSACRPLHKHNNQEDGAESSVHSYSAKQQVEMSGKECNSPVAGCEQENLGLHWLSKEYNLQNLTQTLNNRNISFSSLNKCLPRM